MLNKRKHIGLLIEGAEAPETLLAMASAARHLPAPKSMEDFTPDEDKLLIDATDRANEVFDKLINNPRSSLRRDWETKNLKEHASLREAGGIMGILNTSTLTMEQSEDLKKSDMHITQCHKKMLDWNATSTITELASELSKNKWILGAKVYPEKLVNGIGNLRFDIVIDTTGRVRDGKMGFERNPVV